jgi:hypothetical protein
MELKFRATSEQWAIFLGEYSSSGKSVRGYCRDKGIPYTQMIYHLRRSRAVERKSGFIELRPESASGKIWIEAGSCRIHIERGFDALLLRQVAEALS